ncbi:MAG: type III-B CRISPR module RAMP protein Cmr4 [Methylococcaceae bacterium]|nr:type III-B CRISPR module RAMP protein Cmr4 [Methylococcaceae bacterium]
MKSFPLFLYALDPTHIGAGGYRLGRVDLTVLRDAATQLPKIPGSSINGATRAASIYSLQDPGEQTKARQYARATLDEQNKKRPHGGGDDPVAQIFGYAEGDSEGSSRIGLVSFRDAEIFAFPVPTMLGPRWVTTPFLLERAGRSIDKKYRPANEEQIFIQGKQKQRLNLGWLLLDAEPGDLPFPDSLLKHSGMDYVKDHLILVHENLFPALVNSNLETRTSVSIDFETGAGVEGALFTYEAMPRGTLYRGQVDFDDLRFPDLYHKGKTLVEHGLDLACALGLGAMTTRGFGRMQAMLVEG